MTLFDYGVILVIVLSGLISFFRGAVSEVLALIGWIISFWVAKQYALKTAQFLPASLDSEPLRMMLSFAILFALTLILMMLFRMAVSGLVKWVGMQSLDRGLGVLFGIARGLVIVVAGVLAAGLTTLPKSQVWQAAVFSPPLERVAIEMKSWLPEKFSNEIHYN